jgi:hypothetical protein
MLPQVAKEYGWNCGGVPWPYRKGKSRYWRDGWKDAEIFIYEGMYSKKRHLILCTAKGKIITARISASICSL